MRPVDTKADFVRRFEAGEFGNRMQTWSSVSAWAASGDRDGLYHLRNRRAGGLTIYSLPGNRVGEAAAKHPGEDWYVSRMAPHDRTVIQGEAFRSYRGLELLWTRNMLPMRSAFKIESRVATGLVAEAVLRSHLDPVDCDWLGCLVDRYSGHVVEFSSFGCRCGTLNRRMIVWEVRNY